MGMLSQKTQEEWQQQLKAMERGTEKHIMVKLPCCGTHREVDYGYDQYVVCPNERCGKKNLLSWSLNPKVSLYE